ncbi:hypothetical protein ScPMuIL_007692 [Solemya velum]
MYAIKRSRVRNYQRAESGEQIIHTGKFIQSAASVSISEKSHLIADQYGLNKKDNPKPMEIDLVEKYRQDYYNEQAN